jgi:hypothetical protein
MVAAARRDHKKIAASISARVPALGGALVHAIQAT